MTSKRSHEGYLLIDNRNTPGVSDSEIHKTGVDLPTGAGKGLFEAATYTCSHCQTVVVLNPLRNRERAYCMKCDHYICDNCGTIKTMNGGECKTFKQLIDEVQELAVRSDQSGSPLILPSSYII